MLLGMDHRRSLHIDGAESVVSVAQYLQEQPDPEHWRVDSLRADALFKQADLNHDGDCNHHVHHAQQVTRAGPE